MVQKLKKGQIVVIHGRNYTVQGMIEFNEDTLVWQEYKVADSAGRVHWLNVEEDNGKTIYSLYDLIYTNANAASMQIKFGGNNYYHHEKGVAGVKSYFGNVDVDPGEKCNYTQYINEDKNAIITIEDWGGEIEKSRGVILKPGDVRITDDIADTIAKVSAHNIGNGNFSNIINRSTVIALLFIILVMVIGLFNSNKMAISKFISKSSSFTYVTSITNSINKEKAKVYETSLSVHNAVLAIIDGVPETITQVKEEGNKDTALESAAEDGVGLLSSKEYAYVYTANSGKTYVQVSKRAFVSNTNAYQSSTHNHHYYRLFSDQTSSSNSSIYTNYWQSARQSSIAARQSSGGGTSSGK